MRRAAPETSDADFPFETAAFYPEKNKFQKYHGLPDFSESKIRAAASSDTAYPRVSAMSGAHRSGTDHNGVANLIPFVVLDKI